MKGSINSDKLPNRRGAFARGSRARVLVLVLVTLSHPNKATALVPKDKDKPQLKFRPICLSEFWIIHSF